jgi:hypothetical protein
MSPTEHTNEDTGVEPDRGSADGPTRASILGIGAVIFVVAVLIMLHLSGVLGSGGH